MTKTAPYGTWQSPISADMLTGQAIGLGPVESHNGVLYWTEQRPTEGGRTALVARDKEGAMRDLLPEPFNVRSRVHEYGGGASFITHDLICFVNFADQRLYRARDGESPAPITPDSSGKLRYADLAYDRERERLICIREDHRGAGEPANVIVGVTLPEDAEGGTVLVTGNDFYAYPRLSPDGSQLAWISWDHPNMPWDGTDLWCAPVQADGTLGKATHIAGGPEISIFQPEWSPNGTLHFVSDESGWWNLYRADTAAVRNICPMNAEFGLPLWNFGMRTYRFLDDGSILCAYLANGVQHFGHIRDGELAPFRSPFRSASVPIPHDGKLVATGAGRSRTGMIGIIDGSGNLIDIIKSSASFDVDPSDISLAEPISFPSKDGETAHGWFYPPRNSACEAAQNERPPLIVLSHGGPTAMSDDAFRLDIQYWTTRGFAVADINYGGSTGYGRDYRARLDGQWGIVDVADCIAAAEYLVKQGQADGSRLCIRGGSAGGYTTLCALTFHDVFKAGASRYGIGDLMALARDTHKFEARYLDRLVAPLPEGEKTYAVRSPINFADRLNCPVIFFQGLDDKVVPPNQAEEMVAALRTNGLPVAYVPFEGEGHGFRKAENIKRVLEAELYFYGKVFGFEPAGDIVPVEIDNLQDGNGDARRSETGATG